MEINLVVAENLKKLRTERNLSLGQLAELSGVSKVMLSQIEKGDTNPTINILWKIANGLKVSYTALMERQQPDATFVGKPGITAQVDEDGHFRLYCYYASTPERNFEFFQIELDAGHSHTTDGHLPRSQEYIMVLEGELTLTAGGQTYRLKADDAIGFAASGRHTYAATGETTVKAALINHYPD